MDGTTIKVQRMATIENSKYHLHKTIADIFPELLFLNSLSCL